MNQEEHSLVYLQEKKQITADIAALQARIDSLRGNIEQEQRAALADIANKKAEIENSIKPQRDKKRTLDAEHTKVDKRIKEIDNELNNPNIDVNDDLMIIKTISPYIYQNGNLINYARVIIGSAMQKQIAVPDICETDVDKADDKQSVLDNTNVQAAIMNDEIEGMMKYAKIL